MHQHHVPWLAMPDELHDSFGIRVGAERHVLQANELERLLSFYYKQSPIAQNMLRIEIITMKISL